MSYPRRAFTLVELIAAIAIVAILVAVMIPAVGNFVSQSRQTADRQTLAVLNDAINRYKMQGGDITALTSNLTKTDLLTLLSTPVSWHGINHQFLRSSETIDLEKTLATTGAGTDFRITEYGSSLAESGGTTLYNDLNLTDLLLWHDFNSISPSYGTGDATLRNSATISGGYGSTFAADSSDFYIPSPAGYPSGVGLSDCSWAIRFRPNSIPAYGGVFLRAYRDALYYRNDLSVAATSAGWVSPGVSAPAFTIGNWYTVVCTYELATHTRRLYVNGVEVGSETKSDTNGTGTGSWYFGQQQGNYADNDISWFSLWKRVLSPDEVTRLHNGNADYEFSDL